MGLGSNVHGNYRMDDFFGNMSGNPYNWRGLYDLLAGDKEIQNVTASAQTSDLAGLGHVPVLRKPGWVES